MIPVILVVHALTADAPFVTVERALPLEVERAACGRMPAINGFWKADDGRRFRIVTQMRCAR